MELTLTVRHGDATDAIKQYIQDEVRGLSKYFERLVEADIVLDHQNNHRHIVEIRVHTSNDTHFASAEAADFRTAADQTIEKMRRQLKRHKGKLAGRAPTGEERARILGTIAATEAAVEAEGAGPEAGAAEAAPPAWDRVSTQEAIARLLASGEEVLVFVDSVDDVVKIARRDGEGGVDVVEAEAFEVEEG